MKAVGLYKHLPIEDPNSLVDLDVEQPKYPTGHDLLVVIIIVGSSLIGGSCSPNLQAS